MRYFSNLSIVSLGVRPRSRRGTERTRQGEGRWNRPPKPALERSYLTENSSSANRILRPRRKKLLTESLTKIMIVYYIFIYLVTLGQNMTPIWKWCLAKFHCISLFIHQDPKNKWRVPFKIKSCVLVACLAQSPSAFASRCWTDWPATTTTVSSQRNSCNHTTKRSIHSTALIITPTFRSASTFRLWR